MGLLRRPTPGGTWTTADWARPPGRAQPRAISENQVAGFAAILTFPHEEFVYVTGRGVSSCRARLWV
jgi:hypothetical protein